MINWLKNQRGKQNPFEKNLTRLVYFAGDRPSARIEDTTTSRPSMEELKHNIKAAKEKVKTSSDKVTKAVEDYNKKFGTGGSRVYEKALKINTNKPADGIKTITDLLNAKWKVHGVEYRLIDGHVPSTARQNQPDALKQLVQFLKDHTELLAKLKKATDAKENVHGYALLHRSRRVDQIRSTQEKFKNSPHYRALASDYRAAFNGLMGRDPQFKAFYKRLDQTTGSEIIDTRLEREHRQLFFAILARETNNFKTDFVFGKMGADWEKNRKMYPFVYEQWMKGRVDRNAIKRAETVVAKHAEAAKTSPDQMQAALKAKIDHLNASAKGRDMANLNPPVEFTDFTKDLPKKKGLRYYLALKEAAKNFQDEIARTMRRLQTYYPKHKSFIEDMRDMRGNQLPKLIALAGAKYDLEWYKEKNKKTNESFTKANLSKPGNRQIVLEIAMLKFQRAMRIADQPLGAGSGVMGRQLNPAVRRMMIALVYKQGVGYVDAQGKYQKDVANHYKTMFGQMVQSPYFNRQSKEKFLDPEQREMMIITSYANFAYFHAKYLKERIVKGLDDLNKLRIAKNKLAAEPDARTNPAKKTKLEKMEADLKSGLREMTRLMKYANLRKEGITEDNLEHAISNETQRLRKWEEFRTDVDNLMKNPNREAVRHFIDGIKYGRVLTGEVAANRKKMEKMAGYLQGVDLTYNSVDFKQRSETNYLERMGIRVDGIYGGYTEYLKSHPDMKVDNWDRLMRTKAGIAKLTAMFKKILPDSNVFKGKGDFLAVFQTLHGKTHMSTPALRDHQVVAISIYSLIKKEIRGREQVRADTNMGNQNAMDKLNGATLADRMTDGAKGMVQMIIGPGQSIANRAAGVVMLVAAWKLARKAIRGDGKSGKLLRVAFLAGAAELWMKHTYGEGITDKMRLTGLSEALEGTYEAVLMDRAEKQKVPITKTEHAAGLIEMRHTPMNELMDWYEATDINGRPLPGKKHIKLPRSIDLDNVIRGSATKNRDARGRLVIKAIMRNFFGLVGGKAGKDEIAGKNIVKERWLSALSGKKYDPSKFKEAQSGIPPLMADAFRQNPRALTWHTVMYGEIPKHRVDEVKNSRNYKIFKDYIVKKGHAISRWSRQTIEQNLLVGMDEFFKNVQTRYAPQLKDFLGRMGEAGATNLKFGLRSITLWYKGNRMKIRQFGNDMWEVVSEGAKFPFFAMYYTGSRVFPLVSTKLKQTRLALASNKIDFISRGQTVDANWISQVPAGSRNPVFTGIGRSRGINTRIRPEDFINPQKNPQFTHFGIYQLAFMRALNNRDRYYETQPLGAGADRVQSYLKLQPHVGYYVSETTPQQTKVRPNDSVENQYHLMVDKARKQAEDFFINEQHVRPEIVRRYLYPIHTTVQGQRGSAPARMFTFWRLPLAQSREVTMGNRWTDFENPNLRKFRPPFLMDPKRGILDNLKMAYGAYSPAARKGAGYATLAASQWIRAIFGAVEFGGNASAATLGRVFRRWGIKQEHTRWITDITHRDEKTLQQIDQYLGSAADPRSAMSKFYKNRRNALNYKQALRYARTHRLKLEDVLAQDQNPHTRRPWRWQQIKYTPKYGHGPLRTRGGRGRPVVKRINGPHLDQ